MDVLLLRSIGGLRVRTASGALGASEGFWEGGRREEPCGFRGGRFIFARGNKSPVRRPTGSLFKSRSSSLLASWRRTGELATYCLSLDIEAEIRIRNMLQAAGEVKQSKTHHCRGAPPARCLSPPARRCSLPGGAQPGPRTGASGTYLSLHFPFVHDGYDYAYSRRTVTTAAVTTVSLQTMREPRCEIS